MFSHMLDHLGPGIMLKGRKHRRPMHGEQCGIGAIMMVYLHGGDWEKIRDALKTIGAPVTSEELGVAVESCYEPLNNSQLYKPLTKKRYNINEEYFKKADPSRFSLPVCEKVFRDESIAFHHSVLLGEKIDMDDILNAVVKIKENVDELL